VADAWAWVSEVGHVLFTTAESAFSLVAKVELAFSFEGFEGLEGVDLVAVVDPGGDVHGVAQGRDVLSSVGELIEKGIDYAMVAAPTALHEEIGLELAAAGVHTMVEKPLAVDTPASKRLVSAFANLVGAVGHIERYNPALQQLRSRLGELGEVYQITTRRQGPFPARIADVGVVKDLATHDIDLTAWVAQSSFKSISARTAFKSGRVHEDVVAAVGQLTNGIVTNHLVNWLTPFKERLTVVTGERGAFIADTLTADLTFYANASIATEWEAVAAFRGARPATSCSICRSSAPRTAIITFGRIT